MDIKGYLKGKAKQRILDSHDIFLFPTYYGEGRPIVLLEAMGAGLAVISTPVAAIPEIVKNEENGIIVDSREPIDFFKAVRRLIEDLKLLCYIKKHNKEIAKRFYDAKVVT